MTGMSRDPDSELDFGRAPDGSATSPEVLQLLDGHEMTTVIDDHRSARSNHDRPFHIGLRDAFVVIDQPGLRATSTPT